MSLTYSYGGGTWSGSVYGGPLTVVDSGSQTDAAVSPLISATTGTVKVGKLTTASVASGASSEIGRAIDGSPDPAPFGAGSWASGGYGGGFRTKTGVPAGPTTGDITATTFDSSSKTDVGVQPDTAAGFARTFDEGTTTLLSLRSAKATAIRRLIDNAEPTDFSVAPRAASSVSVADVIRFVALVGEVQESRAVPGERDATQEFATSDEDDDNN